MCRTDQRTKSELRAHQRRTGQDPARHALYRRRPQRERTTMANATVTRSRVLACAAVLGATPAGADTAAPDHWLGTWAGTWPDGSAYTELRVTRIEPSGAVIGTVCDRPAGRPRFIVDIGPEGHIEARLKDELGTVPRTM